MRSPELSIAGNRKKCELRLLVLQAARNESNQILKFVAFLPYGTCRARHFVGKGKLWDKEFKNMFFTL